MDFRPLHDRVVLKRDERQRHSPGGILVPDTAGEKPTGGRVMAVGKGKILENGRYRRAAGRTEGLSGGQDIGKISLSKK